jgi:hypothetical protein
LDGERVSEQPFPGFAGPQAAPFVVAAALVGVGGGGVEVEAEAVLGPVRQLVGADIDRT